jgi:hypothetical protein
MRGHDALIAIRLKGEQPEWVFINDFPCNTDWQKYNDYATISVFGDKIRSLDMRFLVGCRATIASTSESRAKALLDACKPYCELVAASAINPSQKFHLQTGWSEVWFR